MTTHVCSYCGFIQNESYKRCLECGNAYNKQRKSFFQEEKKNLEEIQEIIPPSLPTPLSPSPSSSTFIDLSSLQHILPLIAEIGKREHDAQLCEIRERVSFLEQLQVNLARTPDIHVYVPEPTPVKNETVSSVVVAEPRKTVKIVERDENGLIIKITEQEQEQEDQ